MPAGGVFVFVWRAKGAPQKDNSCYTLLAIRFNLPLRLESGMSVHSDRMIDSIYASTESTDR